MCSVQCSLQVAAMACATAHSRLGFGELSRTTLDAWSAACASSRSDASRTETISELVHVQPTSSTFQFPSWCMCNQRRPLSSAPLTAHGQRRVKFSLQVCKLCSASSEISLQVCKLYIVACCASSRRERNALRTFVLYKHCVAFCTIGCL